MPRQYPIEKTRNIGIIAHIDASLRLLARSWTPFKKVSNRQTIGGKFFSSKPPFKHQSSLDFLF
jgi:hypothetical protein